MRRITLCAAILLLCAAAVLAQAPQFTRYNSADGHYSVLTPSEPKLSTQQSKAPDGTTVEQHLATAGSSDGAYVIGYFDLGSHTFDFDKARDGAIARINGSLLTEHNIALGSNPGREFKALGKFG